MVAGEQDAALTSFDPLRLERRPQLRDVDPQRVLLTLRVVAPQLLQDAISGHHPIGVEQQQCEERPLLGRADVNPPTKVDNFERTEDPEFHAPPCAGSHG